MPKKKEDAVNGLHLENLGESHPEILCGLLQLLCKSKTL